MTSLLSVFPAYRPLLLNELEFPVPLSIVVLAPHPDDFDAIGVSMRFLQQQGHEIHLAVLTTGVGGIEDGWNGVVSANEKAAIRETEQAASCRFFGLPDERLSFLRLWEPNASEDKDQKRVQDENADDLRLRAYLVSRKPHLVFLPHGNDSNKTHRRTYEAFRSIALTENLQVCACLNLDAKTLSFRPDMYMYFGEHEAAWKAQLLRFHRSQQERNLKSRHQGFDQRVLQVNREAALKGDREHPYAEVFELEFFGQTVPVASR